MKYIKLYEDYESDNFINWFGKSVIVDNENKPLIMYHGSPHSDNIKSFKNNVGYHFFTSSIDEAVRYTPLKYPQPSDFTTNGRLDKGSYEKAKDEYKSSEDRYVRKYYIRAEKPFDATNMSDKEKDSVIKLLNDNIFKLINHNSLKELVSELRDYERDWLLEVIQNEPKMEGLGEEVHVLYTILTSMADNYLLLELPIIQNWIKKGGYDSFYTIESGWGINIAVYGPDQIKSVNNNGNWSNSDNIYEGGCKFKYKK